MKRFNCGSSSGGKVPFKPPRLSGPFVRLEALMRLGTLSRANLSRDWSLSASQRRFLPHAIAPLALPLFLFLLLIMPSQTSAQLYTGSIAGTVTDSSGAVIPNVQVKATDEAKGIVFSGTTDSAGRYVIRQLPPAKYTVLTSASGFVAERRSGIIIEINQNASVDFSLKVGAASELVDVTAEAI